MNIAIIGAGAVALSSAALLAQRGHEVRIWSALAEEVEALRTSGTVTSEGELVGSFPVSVASGAHECVRDADVVMVAAPAFAHAPLMQAIAGSLDDGQAVVVHSATAMTSLILARLLAERGRRPLLIELGTSVCTSRKTGPTRARVAPLKPGVDVATLPAARREEGRGVMERLFGDLFTARENLLAVSLNNHNGIYHVPALVFNLPSVEQAIPWNIWTATTPLIAQYIGRLDGERLDVAEAFAVRGVPVGDYIRQSVGVRGDDLATVFAEAGKKRPNPTGPTSLADRYVSEDVPYGLGFFHVLGTAAGVSMPLTEQLIAFVSAVFQRNFAAEAVSLADLGLAGLSPDGIMSVVSQGFAMKPSH
jgi:opine dehydrogenase